MTVQAFAWAIDQPLPGKAKLVLLALANHADHTTGQVHFDASLIAREASIAVPSLWRYLGALERNGYLAHDERRGKSDADKRDYWLALDRDPSVAWAWAAQDGEADDADGLDRLQEPSTAPRSAPSTFNRAAQDAQRKVNVAPPADQPPDKPFFVIEGSRAHTAWCRYLTARRQLVPYVMSRIVEGQERRGFWRASLFPAAETVEADRGLG